MLAESFRKVYLNEAPQRLDSGGSAYDILLIQLQDVASRKKSTKVSEFIYTVSDGDVDYFWAGSEDASAVAIAVSLDRTSPGTSVVDLSAKNPEGIGQPPFASDLYVAAATFLGKKIRFTGGKILSSDGLKAWQQLFKHGHTISVYDNQTNTFAVNQVSSLRELEQYWDENPDFQRFQYVLSEDSGAAFIRGDFAIMEWKRLSGWPLV